MSESGATTRELAVVEMRSVGAATNALGVANWTVEDLEALKQTVGANLTNAEFRVFMAAARRLGLDPFARQIYALKLDDRMTPQVSIDGLRLVAERTGKYAGQLGPYWCGPDGNWMEVWLANEAPVAARVGVLRRDFDQPMWGVARLKSYARSTRPWDRLPDVMIAKVAESLALRRAFPNELSGVYIAEEMQQAQLETSNEQDFEAETRGRVTISAAPHHDEMADPPHTRQEQPLTLRGLYERAQKLGVSAKRWAEIKATATGSSAAESLVALKAELDHIEYVATGTQASSEHVSSATDEKATTEQQAEIEYLCLLLGIHEPHPDTAIQAELNLKWLRKKAREAGHEISEENSEPTTVGEDQGAAEGAPIEHDLRGLGPGKGRH